MDLPFIPNRDVFLPTNNTCVCPTISSRLSSKCFEKCVSWCTPSLFMGKVEKVHVVWLQSEHSPTSSAQSPTSTRPSNASSPSAVGVYLERLSVAPTPAATAASASASSPVMSPNGDGPSSKYISGRLYNGPGESASSPKARAQRGGSISNNSEKQVVTKVIELDGLSAYTKESTADWLVIPPIDGSDDDRDEEGENGEARSRIRLRPPVQGSASAAGTESGATASSTEGVSVSANNQRDGRPQRSPKDHCETAPVFILCPLKIRGNLAIHEGVAGQTVQASVADPGRAATAGVDGSDATKPPAGGADDDRRSNVQVEEPPPLAAVSLDVEALALQLDVRQYAVLNEAVSAVLMSQRRFRFRTMRPTTSVLEDPEGWWRYAIRYAHFGDLRDGVML